MYPICRNRKWGFHNHGIQTAPVYGVLTTPRCIHARKEDILCDNACIFVIHTVQHCTIQYPTISTYRTATIPRSDPTDAHPNTIHKRSGKGHIDLCLRVALESTEQADSSIRACLRVGLGLGLTLQPTKETDGGIGACLSIGVSLGLGLTL